MLDAIRGLIAWTPLGLPAFLFVITLVVFFHELGHFLVARAFGVKVDIFSVGFGTRDLRLDRQKGTRWKISWLPLGGYVKFAGDAERRRTPDRAAAARMTDAERDRSADPFKPLYQRALVVAAGPLANFVLAIVLLTGILIVHRPCRGCADHRRSVPRAARRRLAGIKTGDRVTRSTRPRSPISSSCPRSFRSSSGGQIAIGSIAAART